MLSLPTNCFRNGSTESFSVTSKRATEDVPLEGIKWKVREIRMCGALSACAAVLLGVVVSRSSDLALLCPCSSGGIHVLHYACFVCTTMTTGIVNTAAITAVVLMLALWVQLYSQQAARHALQCERHQNCRAASRGLHRLVQAWMACEEVTALALALACDCEMVSRG